MLIKWITSYKRRTLQLNQACILILRDEGEDASVVLLMTAVLGIRSYLLQVYAILLELEQTVCYVDQTRFVLLLGAVDYKHIALVTFTYYAVILFRIQNLFWVCIKYLLIVLCSYVFIYIRLEVSLEVYHLCWLIMFFYLYHWGFLGICGQNRKQSDAKYAICSRFVGLILVVNGHSRGHREIKEMRRK